MKCIKCNTDANKKDRTARGNKCPSCHHPFVTDPQTDGLTDRAILTAENLVSSDGKFHFLKDHLKYQLLRRARKKMAWWGWGVNITLLVLMLSGAYAVRGGTIVIPILSGLFLLICLGAKASLNKTIVRVKPIVDKWIQINPNDKLLTDKTSRIGQTLNTESQDLEDISFERVLICDRDEYVDFFLANLFHFHYSCPVLGGNEYPKGVCADMLQRLKKNQKLDVFLLHDFTPEGYVFANHIKTESRWFGQYPHFNIIDLGLLKEQERLCKSMLVKQKDLLAFNSTKRLSRANKKVAELTLFKPEVLITLCGMAINEKVTLDKVSSKAGDSSSGYG